MSPRRRHFVGWLVITIASVFRGPVSAAEPTTSPRDESGAARLREMRTLAKLVTVKEETAPRPAELVGDPIVRYDDQPRRIEDASLWIFGERGRPAAALKVEIYAQGHALHGIVSLSPKTIDVEGADGWQWSSTQPGVDLQEIPGAPAPAESPAARLAQMKALSRRFSGYEDEPPPRRRLHMRLIPRPIYRYDDSDAGLIDGAIFSLANGTNPDVLLLIEARGKNNARGPSTWQYGSARQGGAVLVINLDGKEVWRQPKAFPPAVRETYMNRMFPRAGSAPR